tara:strand:+ start:2026 stop:2493 length:468 start_codon:yes stop_codon:yes gene_type:complete
MKTVIKNTNVALMYAFLTTVALGLYFILMRTIGLADNPLFRIFNFGILFMGIFKSISTFKDILGEDFTYFRGLIMGIKTALFTAFLFSASILVYYLFDAPFIDQLLIEGRISGAGSIFGLIGVILIEAIGSGFISSFMCMQYLKKSLHVLPDHSH